MATTKRRSARSLRCPLGLLLTVAATLAACTVGPDFRPPDAHAPAGWHDLQRNEKAATAGAARHESPVVVDADPDPRWWHAFQDPMLDRLIERARAGNLDLQQAVLRIAEARIQVQSTAAQGLPNLRASARYQREQLGLKGLLQENGVYDDADRLAQPGSPIDKISPGAGAAAGNGLKNALNNLSSPINLWQAGFDASWELDFFGRVRRSVESAQAQVQAAGESRNDALLSLEAEVAQTYLQLRGAQAGYDLAKQLVDDAQQTLRLTQSQASVGLASALDVKQAAAQVADTEAQLPPYDGQIVQAENGLALLVGAPPGSLDAELERHEAVPPVPPSVSIGLPATLARRRPDIRQAEAQLHAATANVGVAVAQFFPDISLTGQIGTRAQYSSDLARWSHLFYSFGPAISLPIFSGGTLRANLRLSNAREAEAALDYRKTVLVALRDVDNALAVYRSDLAHRDALGRSVDADQSAFDLARERYAKGFSTFIQVLDAQTRLAQAKQQYVQATTQVATDLVALYKALGGGWQQT
ncbi:efflux transporter outer membrane subunit [Trinickia sp. EG282A]|uniref:efflux transporter outer membrane subunit n=1 Tax=Trinickia sp. EG282A TaxID=3237013 RepID=UPI0034D2CF84